MPATVCLADFDLPTRSASGSLLRYVVPRIGPVTLYSMLAQRPLFNANSPKSDFILIMGHGNEDTVTGQNDTIILKAGQYDPRLIQGKVIRLLSCKAGAKLGKDLVDNGAWAVIGYTDDYLWIVDEEKKLIPWEDTEYALKCLKPVIDGINALLDGATVKESYDIEIAGYATASANESDELIRSCLDFNREHIVLYGDHNARIKYRPNVRIPVAPPPIIFPLVY